MEQKFKALTAAMDELEWNDRRQQLQTVQQNFASTQYFIAFIGQYSAGKSCLINNLLGKVVLPTGVTETTPLLTYIRYGQQENGCLHYLDGTTREIAIDEVSSVVQNSSTWNFENLDYLEISLPSELLRSGLILLDTPGINTVIERHEKLLAYSLNQASKIIYVTGQAPHKTDIDMIGSLKDRGVDMAFVRTHCDEIRSKEEDPAGVLNDDKCLLANCGISAENCFHVSNLPSSHWYGNIEELKCLISQVGSRVTQELATATNMRLQKMAEDCLAALDKRRKILADKAGDDELRKCKLEVESNISRFESLISDRKSKLAQDISDCDQKIMGSIMHNAEGYIAEGAERIKNCDSSIQTPEQMSALFDSEAKRILERIITDINIAVYPILHGIHSGLQLESFSLSDDIIPSFETYSELTLTQDLETEHLIERLNFIRENRSGIEAQLQKMSNDPQYSDLQQNLLILEQEIQEVQKTYDALPPYTPQFIEIDDGRMQPSEIAKGIGNIADWALLLIPGKSIENVIKSAAESEKIIKPLAKAIGKSEKVISAISKSDNIKDILFALKNMSDTRATKGRRKKAQNLINGIADGVDKIKQNISESEADPSILDYLTIQHWAEQIGKKFDRPPKLTIDTEYESQYQQAKNRVEKELLDRQQKLYHTNCELNVFRNEQERLRAEKEACVVDEQQVMQEMEKRKSEIARKAEESAYSKWKIACSNLFKQKVSNQIESILSNYLSALSARMTMYQEESISKIRTRLEENRNTYLTLSEACYEEQDNLDRVNSLMAEIRGLFV